MHSRTGWPLESELRRHFLCFKQVCRLTTPSSGQSGARQLGSSALKGCLRSLSLTGCSLHFEAHHGLEWVNFGGRSEFQALLTGAKRVLSLAEIGYGDGCLNHCAVVSFEMPIGSPGLCLRLACAESLVILWCACSRCVAAKKNSLWNLWALAPQLLRSEALPGARLVMW